MSLCVYIGGRKKEKKKPTHLNTSVILSGNVFFFFKQRILHKHDCKTVVTHLKRLRATKDEKR